MKEILYVIINYIEDFKQSIKLPMTASPVMNGMLLLLLFLMLMTNRLVNNIPAPLKAIIVPFAIGSVVRCVKAVVFPNHCFITLRFLILALPTSMLVIGVNVRKTEFRLSTFFRTLLLKECEFRFNFGTPREQLKTLQIWCDI